MKTGFRLHFLIIILFFALSKESFSQSGYIIRPCENTTGKDILDPNSDDYSSKTASGFGSDDIANSEVPYKPIRSFIREPYGDLRRGPDHLYSDFVPDPNSNGYYIHFDSTATRKNMMFRMRMGSIIPGSKGFSVLIDVDGKFGSAGADADPNYQAATTGINGNPGFEIELVLTTQTSSQAGLEIYNVDGTSNPVLIKSYTNYKAYSQISVSRTSDNGDPDFYLDWYVPFSDLVLAYPSLTTSTPLRMIPTTVMAPKPAIGGPKSDIYGLSDAGYPNSNDQYEAFINNQKPIQPASLIDSSTTIAGTLCTAAPVVNLANSITRTVTGTWTKSLDGSAATATIGIYKNGNYAASIGTISNVTSGSTWTSASNLNFVVGDVITARALAAGETDACFAGNQVTALSCAAKPAALTNLCISNKGISGEGWTSGDYIRIFRVTATGNIHIATGIPGVTALFATVAGVTGGWAYSGGCAGNGNAKLEPGQYVAYDSTAAGCVSASVFICNQSVNGQNSYAASPAIALTNPTTIFASSGSLSGTYGTGTGIVRVYLDSVFLGNATLSAGNWSYSLSGVKLSVGQVFRIAGQQADAGINFYCATVITSTVTCKTASPIITADASRKISAGSPISGISGEPVGTTITVYGSATYGSGYNSVATATVSGFGTWSTTTYNAVNGYYYYAAAKNGTCASSLSSDTANALPATSSARCGSITTANITSATTSISGTLSGTQLASTKVKLYLDDYAIDSIYTSNNTWGPIDVTGKLFANGTLKIGIQEPSGTEVICTTSAVAINCSSYPAQPDVTPENVTISPNTTQTYTVLNPQANVFYGLSDSATGSSLGLGKWAIPVTSPFELTTNIIKAPTIVYIKATSVSAAEVCTIRAATKKISLMGNSTLPVTLVTFNGRWANDDVVLDWLTAHEYNSSSFEIERSTDGVSYEKIGKMAVRGNMTGASYTCTDPDPLDVNYYRLRMIEAGGKYSYSKVIRIVQKPAGVVLNSAQPNPFAGEFSISLTMAEQQTVRMTLIDAGGRAVLQKETTGNRGLNIIKFNELEHYADGLYIIRIMTNTEVLQQKLIKKGAK